MIYRLTGLIFSDLGQASSFMALEWVQRALQECLGYRPFPATLNLRPSLPGDGAAWALAQKRLKGIPLPSASDGFCSAQLFPVDIIRPITPGKEPIRGAVLVPAVADYPKDKIEVVAPMPVKEKLAVTDGDQLTLEFVP
jgi:riboflavin kinase, archaea type